MTATSQGFVKLVKNILQKKEKLKQSLKYIPAGSVVVFVVFSCEKVKKDSELKFSRFQYNARDLIIKIKWS